MIDAVSDEIENIEPEEKMRFEVLAFRVDLFRRAQKWDGMEVVARHLAKIQPGEPRWCLDLAWAVRRGAGLAVAKAVLEAAEARLPWLSISNSFLRRSRQSRRRNPAAKEADGSEGGKAENHQAKSGGFGDGR